MKNAFVYISVILLIFVGIIMSSFLNSSLPSFGGSGSSASASLSVIPVGVIIMFISGFVIFVAIFGMAKLWRA